MRLSPSAKASRGIWSGAGLLILLSAFPVFGSTITVTNTNDSGPGSLRNAIATAADGDTIDFSLAYPATITVGTPLAIESSTSKTLTINGPGASLLAISGGNAVSVFVVQPLGGLGGAMTVTISGLTIERGSSVVGGGLFNGGRLTLNRCTIAGNSLGNQLGGGIFNAGTLIVRASTVKANNPSTTQSTSDTDTARAMTHSPFRLNGNAIGRDLFGRAAVWRGNVTAGIQTENVRQNGHKGLDESGRRRFRPAPSTGKFPKEIPALSTMRPRAR